MLNSKELNQLASQHLADETSSLKFSVIIPVYNDWTPLNECLRSLAQQENAPSFEIIVVDDGSIDVSPTFRSNWDEHYPLRFVRQVHAGISVARNRGIQAAKAPMVLFVDADCRLDMNCLQLLERSTDALPLQNYFQLHLVGDCSKGLVGKAEALRLMVLQNEFLRFDHFTRYLNTAGFAIRRSKAESEAGLFDPVAVRAEDTLLLANLIRNANFHRLCQTRSSIMQYHCLFSLICARHFAPLIWKLGPSISFHRGVSRFG
jgi:Glycosyltransferases involved in cell wall biogenesis